ncbi:MAG TPA: hypothetical protein VMN57_04330 [Anaerolineales bacterium]|nr:hypothetical protein [Anaerolineales bacterium]
MRPDRRRDPVDRNPVHRQQHPGEQDGGDRADEGLQPLPQQLDFDLPDPALGELSLQLAQF